MIQLTPSKLRQYLECPLQYKYRQDDRTPTNETPALIFGSILHRALQQIYAAPETRHELEGLLESLWNPNAFDCYEDSRAYFRRGLNALEHYCAEYLSGAGKPLSDKTVATEEFLSYIVEGDGVRVRFGCKVDRLSLTPDGILEIVDYKTSGNGSVQTVESLATDLPAFIYYGLVRLSFPNQTRIRLKYINVISLHNSAVELSPEQVSRNKDALWSYVKKIDSGVFEPTASESCGWCSYREQCPAMNRSAPLDSIV